MNFLAMRIGPGKHLQGRSLMGGVVKPEEYDHFYEVLIHLRCTVYRSGVAYTRLFFPRSSSSISNLLVSGRVVSWMGC